MIYGAATESLPNLRHHAVCVTVEVKADRYLVTVEEEWTGYKSGGHLGPIKDPKRLTIEFGTLDAFFQESHEVSTGFSSLGEAEGIDQVLLADAMRSAGDRIRDLLLFGGAAHLDDSAAGYLVIDWDEVKCRELLKEAAEDDEDEDDDEDDVEEEDDAE